MYPLKLTGVTRSPIWGGTRLLKEWNKKAEGDSVGESWELTVRDDGMCTVANGAFCGMPLSAVIDVHREEIMGKSKCEDGFPLLIKFIDAADRLSVQVHPDDAYAARVENDRGKTEMWYIVDADEDAEIICGLCEGVDRTMLRDAVARGEVESVLAHRRVKAGECYFIPAGLPHAIGKGILIAEIQQNCDLTYRVYDYDRRDKEGRLRELHVEKALDVIRPFAESEIDKIRFEASAGERAQDVLADCVYFRVLEVKPKGRMQALSRTGRMSHLLCVAGKGELIADGVSYPVARGEGWLLPADLGDVTLGGGGIFLLTEAK